MNNVGDVVWLRLNPVRGQEKAGTRPCLVIEAGHSKLGLIIVLPITHAVGNRPVSVFVNIPDFKSAGLTKPSVLDCYQIRTVSTDRIIETVGSVDNRVLDEVRKRLVLFLDIGEEHLS